MSKVINPTYKGMSIFNIYTPRSGIRYTSFYEWVLAARWANYTWDRFVKLDGIHQSRIVAEYRVSNKIESIMAHEQQKKRNRK